MAAGGGGVIWVGQPLTKWEKDRGLRQDGGWWWECDLGGTTADPCGKKGWRAQQLDEIKRETVGLAWSFNQNIKMVIYKDGFSFWSTK